MKALNKRLAELAFYCLVLVIAVYLLFPIYWAVSLSLQSHSDTVRIPISFYPKHLTFENYRAVLADEALLDSLGSSFLIASTTTILSLLLGTLAAFALARFRFRFRKGFLMLMLAMTTFPTISFLTGLFSIYRFVKWLNETVFWFYLPVTGLLVVMYMIFTLPLAVWLLTYFIQGLPSELFEAARIDGASVMQTFRLIVLPLTVPALVSAGLLTFIASWNEFLFALTFTLLEPDLSTVPVAMSSYERVGMPVGQVMAAALIVTLPIILVTIIFQNRILAGLTAGAVKQ